MIVLQSIFDVILNRKVRAKFEDLSVHYHPSKMLFYCRPFGGHTPLVLEKVAGPGKTDGAKDASGAFLSTRGVSHVIISFVVRSTFSLPIISKGQ